MYDRESGERDKRGTMRERSGRRKRESERIGERR